MTSPAPSTPRAGARSCPICHEPMRAEQRDGVTVDVSPHGHGIFLDRTELFQLTEGHRYKDTDFPWSDLFRREINPPRDPARQLRCPITGEPMRVIEHHGVFIDVSAAGIWLDAGELEALLNNLRLDPEYTRGVALRLSELEF